SYRFPSTVSPAVSVQVEWGYRVRRVCTARTGRPRGEYPPLSGLRCRRGGVEGFSAWRGGGGPVKEYEINVTEARMKFAGALNTAAYEGGRVLIARRGAIICAVISFNELNRLRALPPEPDP